MIRFHKCEIGYSAGKALVCGLDIQLDRGRLYALVGRNGTGKSCLLRSIAGFIEPLGGRMEIEGADPTGWTARQRAQRISFVGSRRSFIGRFNVRELVSLGRFSWGDSSTESPAVAEGIRLLGIGQLAERPIEEISDGEFQKVMIARALAQEAPLMLLDEPTVFLDVVARRELFEILAELSRQKNYCILLSTHEIGLAREYADEALLLDGKGECRRMPASDMTESDFG